MGDMPFSLYSFSWITHSILQCKFSSYSCVDRNISLEVKILVVGLRRISKN
jgi:hypothetical protein